MHLGDAALLDEWAAEVPTRRAALARRVLARAAHGRRAPRAARVPDAVTGGRDTVGLRVPDQPLALELLRAFGGGVAAPSANRFGRVSPTTAADVRADLGDDVDLVLDGGPCRVGRRVDHRRLHRAAARDPARRGSPRASASRRCSAPTVPLRTGGEVAAPGHARRRTTRPGARSSSSTDAEIDDRAMAGARARRTRRRDRRADRRPTRASWRSAHPPTSSATRTTCTRMLRAADARGLDVVLAVVPDGTGLGGRGGRPAPARRGGRVAT